MQLSKIHPMIGMFNIYLRFTNDILVIVRVYLRNDEATFRHCVPYTFDVLVQRKVNGAIHDDIVYSLINGEFPKSFNELARKEYVLQHLSNKNNEILVLNPNPQQKEFQDNYSQVIAESIAQWFKHDGIWGIMN